MRECLKAIYRDPNENIEKIVMETICSLRETKEKEKKALKEKKKPEKAGRLEENSKIPLIFSILCFCLHAK